MRELEEKKLLDAFAPKKALIQKLAYTEERVYRRLFKRKFVDPSDCCNYKKDTYQIISGNSSPSSQIKVDPPINRQKLQATTKGFMDRSAFQARIRQQKDGLKYLKVLDPQSRHQDSKPDLKAQKQLSIIPSKTLVQDDDKMSNQSSEYSSVKDVTPRDHDTLVKHEDQLIDDEVVFAETQNLKRKNRHKRSKTFSKTNVLPAIRRSQDAKARGSLFDESCVGSVDWQQVSSMQNSMFS